MARRDGTLSLRITNGGEKINIDRCPYLQALGAKLSGEKG